MFSSFSPSAEAQRLVISHPLNLTIRPVEHTASSRRFADCSAGVVHPTNQVCCNATCGLCGGHGCSSRPGGPRQCCMPAILRTGRVCESRADVACSLQGSSNLFNSIRARGSRSPLTTCEQASLPPTAVEVPAQLPNSQTAHSREPHVAHCIVGQARGLTRPAVYNSIVVDAFGGLPSIFTVIKASTAQEQTALQRVNSTWYTVLQPTRISVTIGEFTDEGRGKYGYVGTRAGASLAFCLFNGSAVAAAHAAQQAAVGSTTTSATPRPPASTGRVAPDGPCVDDGKPEFCRKVFFNNECSQMGGFKCRATCGFCVAQQNGKSQAMRPRAGDQAIWLGYLRSYENMGVVDASCEGACACEQRVDAHFGESRTSITVVQRIVLRLLPEVPGCCTLKLSISNATSTGGHKFKVLSLLLAQAVSNSWQPPGTKVTAAWTMDSMGEYNTTDDENEKKFISSERREERKANARKKEEEKKAKRAGKGDGAKKLGKADGSNPAAKRGGGGKAKGRGRGARGAAAAARVVAPPRRLDGVDLSGPLKKTAGGLLDLEAARCNVYVHDVSLATRMRVHPMYEPCEWEHHQHALEVWLHRAVKESPWVVATAADADVVYLDGHHFSQWCHASVALHARNVHSNYRGKTAGLNTQLCEGRTVGLAEAPPFSCTGLGSRDHGGCGRPVSVAPPGPIEPIGSTPSYSGAERLARKRGDALLVDRNERSKQHLWKRMVESYAEIPGAPAGRLLPKAIALTSGECQRPYAAEGLGIPKDLVVLPDRAPRAFDVVTPYVVSRPAWLVGDAPPPPAVAWADRKLLFFSGHVPKPFNSRVRYQAWKATRRSADATVFSSTINCTIGAYEICRDDARIESEHQTFCRAACARAAEVKGGANTMVCTPSAAALRRQCKAYTNVDYADELDDVRRTDRVVPHDEYLGHAMSHRFCLVAPGDFVATHKITEAVALGGAGGCIPLFVLPAKHRVESMLPYIRWLDYCSIAYVVREADVPRLAAVIDELRALPIEETEAKRAAMKVARDAFVVRRNASAAAPAAAQYVLAEVCDAARRMRGAKAAKARGGGAAAAAPDLSRCMLPRAAAAAGPGVQ